MKIAFTVPLELQQLTLSILLLGCQLRQVMVSPCRRQAMCKEFGVCFFGCDLCDSSLGPVEMVSGILCARMPIKQRRFCSGFPLGNVSLMRMMLRCYWITMFLATSSSDESGKQHHPGHSGFRHRQGVIVPRNCTKSQYFKTQS